MRFIAIFTALLLFLPHFASAQIYEAFGGQGIDIKLLRLDLPACSNGLDDDYDGLIDFPLDPGCASGEDNDETDLLPSPTPAPLAGGGTAVVIPTALPLPTPTPPVILTPVFLCSDYNGDGKIGMKDLSILLFWWGKTGPDIQRYDCNGDGRINIVDASILFYYWTG